MHLFFFRSNLIPVMVRYQLGVILVIFSYLYGFGETPRAFEVYYPRTNSLVSVHQREHRVCFLQASMTSVGIRALTYPGLTANGQDGNQHHNNDE